MREGKATGPEVKSPRNTSSSINLVNELKCCGDEIEDLLYRAITVNEASVLNRSADHFVTPNWRHRSSGIAPHGTVDENCVGDQAMTWRNRKHGKSRPSKKNGFPHSIRKNAILL